MNVEKIHELFIAIYKGSVAESYLYELDEILKSFSPTENPPLLNLQADDSILITYGDAIFGDKASPLATLCGFMNRFVGTRVSTIHLLPFFPFSSDDGFSVIDYYRVDPQLGEWKDITALGECYDLMFDAVINHISVESAWFLKFLSCDLPYTDYFITVKDGTDLSQVFRPRALPLVTAFKTKSGPVRVWTTFSEDQVDLNYRDPKVLLDIVRVLLMFVARGARFIRLDAIAYIWKEIGTSCLHLPNAHRIVKLFRAIFDELAPYVQIITETNVPHEENISYFGNGTDEAQLVYNFSLPPLVLHAFHTEDVTHLSEWAKTLTLPSEHTSYFNFLASHDGIGVTPARGLIPQEDLEKLCNRVEQLGGYVSYKTNPDGSQSPYELNINYLDALGDPARPDVTDLVRANRFLASQSIMLALRGVPGIYYHSLFGSRGWPEGVEKTGRNRTINREKLNINQLVAEITTRGHLRSLVFEGYLSLLDARRRAGEHVFSPYADQMVLNTHPQVFAVLRSSEKVQEKVLCLTNVSRESVKVIFRNEQLLNASQSAPRVLISRNGNLTSTEYDLSVELSPYGLLWLVI